MPDRDESSPLLISPLRRLRFLFEHLLVATSGALIRVYPRRAALAWGSLFGLIAYLVRRSDRRVAYANLDIMLGDACSRRRKRQIVRRTFCRTGEVMWGLFWVPRLTKEHGAAIFEADAFFGVLRDLEARKKGVVLVTAHYGDWELAPYATALAGFPMMVVAEPVANPAVDRIFTGLRTATGNQLVPPKYALLKLFRGLRRGQRAAVICDVNGRRGRGGVWSNFFGLPVFNGVAMAELALRTQSAIVFGVAIPQGRYGPWRYEISPVIEPVASGDHAEDVRRVTQQVTDYLAELIRREPDHWLWTYKRFKRRLSAEQGGYPYYSKYARVE